MQTVGVQTVDEGTLDLGEDCLEMWYSGQSVCGGIDTTPSMHCEVSSGSSDLRLVDDAAHLNGHFTLESATLFLQEIGGLVERTGVTSVGSDALEFSHHDDSSSSIGGEVQAVGVQTVDEGTLDMGDDRLEMWYLDQNVCECVDTSFVDFVVTPSMHCKVSGSSDTDSSSTTAPAFGPSSNDGLVSEGEISCDYDSSKVTRDATLIAALARMRMDVSGIAAAAGITDREFSRLLFKEETILGFLRPFGHPLVPSATHARWMLELAPVRNAMKPLPSKTQRKNIVRRKKVKEEKTRGEG